MYLTKDNYERIAKWLALRGIRDTDLPAADTLTGAESVVVIQNGKNKLMSLSDVSDSLASIYDADITESLATINDALITSGTFDDYVMSFYNSSGDEQFNVDMTDIKVASISIDRENQTITLYNDAEEEIISLDAFLLSAAWINKNFYLEDSYMYFGRGDGTQLFSCDLNYMFNPSSSHISVNTSDVDGSNGVLYYAFCGSDCTILEGLSVLNAGSGLYWEDKDDVMLAINDDYITDLISDYDFSEIISTYVEANYDLFNPGYYYSTTTSTPGNDKVYIGTTNTGTVSETYPTIWYSNDGDTWILIDKYISPDSSKYYFVSTHQTTYNITVDGTVYSGTAPAGFIGVYSYSAVTDSDGVSTLSYAVVYKNFWGVSYWLSTSTLSSYDETDVSSSNNAYVSAMTLSSILTNNSIAPLASGMVPEVADYCYLWSIDVTDASSLTGYELLESITLESALGNARSFTSYLNYPTFTNSIALTLGSQWVILDSYENGIINGYVDTTGEGTIGSFDYTTSYGYYSNWIDRPLAGEYPLFPVYFIKNILGLFYQNNSEYYSETLDRLLVNSNTNFHVDGMGGYCNLYCSGNNAPEDDNDNNIFSPVFNLTAHVGGFPSSSYSIDLNAYGIVVTGKSDEGQTNSTGDSVGTATYYGMFFDIYKISNMTVKVRYYNDAEMEEHNIYIINFYPSGYSSDDVEDSSTTTYTYFDELYID